MKRSILSQAVICSAIVLAGVLVHGASALAGGFPATGQTTAYQARNNGDASSVPVPDDGTLQRGATLRYKLLKNGTIKDLNTGLMWEMKCEGAGCPALHDASNTYVWSGDGSQLTIWDWLEAINAEGTKGYAGYHDWRIPNRRELESLVDAKLFGPSINPVFGPTTAANYWSSTTYATSPSSAWNVAFSDSSVYASGKGASLFVRAVRGGPK